MLRNFRLVYQHSNELIPTCRILILPIVWVLHVKFYGYKFSHKFEQISYGVKKISYCFTLILSPETRCPNPLKQLIKYVLRTHVNCPQYRTLIKKLYFVASYIPVASWALLRYTIYIISAPREKSYIGFLFFWLFRLPVFSKTRN